MVTLSKKLKKLKIKERMNKLVPILTLCILFTACGGSGNGESTTESDYENAKDAFFATAATLCGETFSGASVYPDNPEHPLVDTELRVHISSCDEDMLRMDLYRDSNTWHGAWVLERRGEGLHLYHDHLGDVRVREDLGEGDYTGYGGYADDRGTATRQYFPADEVTGEIIPEAVTNVWMMEIDLENETFTYYLERHNEPRFRAELTKD
jgi:hypothetical protein